MRKIPVELRRALSVFLSALMILALIPTSVWLLFPVPAQAAGSVKGINLVQNGDVSKYLKQGDTVILGIRDTASSNNFTARWNVLDNQHTNTGADGMLMITEQCLGDPLAESANTPFNPDDVYDNTYQGSQAQAFCQNLYSDYFFDAEKEAIIATTKSDDVYATPYYEVPQNGMEFSAVENILNGDKIFCLSAEEAENVNYFPTAGDRVALFRHKYDWNPSSWWLRSPVESWTTYAGKVDINGHIDTNYISNLGGRAVAMRPALNLDTKKVLFVTSETFGNAYWSAVGADALQSVGLPGDWSQNWLLTLLDSSQSSFYAECTDYTDGVATIEYHNAAVCNYEEYTISAMIVDSQGIVQYYGRVQYTYSKDGSFTLNVGDKYQSGDTLYIFNESKMYNSCTEWASPLSAINLNGCDEYLWVGDVLVTDANKNDVLGDGGKVKYNPDTKTLTLNNPNINAAHVVQVDESTQKKGMIYYVDKTPDNVPLTVKGSWTSDQLLEEYPNAIYAEGSSVKLNGSFVWNQIGGYGVRATDGSITIDNSSVKIDGVGGLRADTSDINIQKSTVDVSAMGGIICEGNLSIVNSDVKSITNIEAVKVGGNIVLDSSHVETEIWGADGGSMTAKGTITLQNDKIIVPQDGSTRKLSGKTYIVDSNLAIANKTEIAVPVLESPKVYAGIKDGVVEVTWDDVDDADAFRLLKKLDGGTWRVVTTTTDLGYMDSAVAEGKTYTYAVRCVDLDGNYTTKYDSTKTASITVPKKALVSPTPTAAVSSGKVKISWTKVTGSPQYRVFRKLDGGSWKILGDTASNYIFDETGVAGKTYIYAVRCLNEDGTKLLSALDNNKLASIVYPTAELVSPTPNLTQVSTGIKISWTKVTGSPMYRIFRKEEGGSWKKLVDVSTNTYTDTTGKAGKTYYYAVRCLDSNGTTLLSKFDSTKTAQMVFPSLAPQSPKPSLTPFAAGIRVDWADVSGAAKYRVYRKVGSGSWKAVKDLTDSNYTDTNVTAGKEYSYAVRCLDADGNLISKFDSNAVSTVTK